MPVVIKLLAIELLCQRTLTYFIRGSICTADLLFDHQQIYLFCQIQTSQSGQPYSDTFPYEVSECSLDVLIPVANRLSHGAL